jgi:hypothetical protein
VNVYRQDRRHVPRRGGVTNAKFVWSPEQATPPEVPAPSSEIRNYYRATATSTSSASPGYNWATIRCAGGGWVSASPALRPTSSTQVGRDFPGKPILITEIGSVPSYDERARRLVRDAFAFRRRAQGSEGDRVVRRLRLRADDVSRLPDHEHADCLRQRRRSRPSSR